MADDVKDLEVYFDGGKIKPSVVRISDLGQLLGDFEKSILEIVSIRNPEIDLKTPLITLGEVREGSLDLVARTAYRSIVIPAYILVSTALSTQVRTNIC